MTSKLQACFFLCACATILTASTAAAVAIPFCIKPCVQTEPSFYTCAKNHANDAIYYIVREIDRKSVRIPLKYHKQEAVACGELLQGQPEKMDVASLVPLSVDRSTVNVSNSNYTLTLVATDLTVDGASEVTVDSIRPVFERKILSLRLIFSKLLLESHYVLDGHILQTVIKTNGFMNATIKGLTISYELSMNGLDKEGKTYLEFNPQESRQFMDMGAISLGGVFTTKTGEDEKLLLQKSLGEMIQKFRDLVAERLKQVTLQVFNVVGSRVPLDQLFPETPKDLAAVEGDEACNSSGRLGNGAASPQAAQAGNTLPVFFVVLLHCLVILRRAPA